MKNSVFCIVGLVGLAGIASAKAEIRTVEGPEPVSTYAVCNHNALFAINDRAALLKKGGRTLTDAGSSFTIGYEPDVFLETKHLVRHSYRSLSASGTCE